MTFSIAGAAVSLAVLAPNLVLLVARPVDGLRTRDAGILATILERAGQVACLVLPFLTGGPGRLDGWLVVVVLAVGGYLGLWVRYLRDRRAVTLYRPLGPLPIPMAVLPVAAFLATSAWLASWWVAAGAAVLAAGHLPNSWATWRMLRDEA